MKTRILIAFILSLFISPSFAQKKNTPAQKPEEGYKFSPVVELKATPVKNQAGTGIFCPEEINGFINVTPAISRNNWILFFIWKLLIFLVQPKYVLQTKPG